MAKKTYTVVACDICTSEDDVARCTLTIGGVRTSGDLCVTCRKGRSLDDLVAALPRRRRGQRQVVNPEDIPTVKPKPKNKRPTPRS